MRFKKEFEQCRTSLILVEPGDAQMIGEFVIPTQAIDDQRDEVGFSTAARTDEKQVVLRDAENKEIVLAADNVEAVQPSRLSMMPDGAVSGLTLQEAADLVEFLATRK